MVALRHSEKLIPPKFTLPVNLSTKQRGFAAKAAATAEPISERIVLPAPHMWDTIVLVIQITVIALFALSAWMTLLANDTRNRRALMQSSEIAKLDARPGA